jgi:hypothetical protein
VTARRFGELDVVTEGLDTPEQVERSPRTVQAVELVASATESLVALEAAQRAPESDHNWDWVVDTLHQVPSEEPPRSSVNG